MVFYLLKRHFCCYNEEEILDYTINELQILLEIMVEDKLVSPSSGVCFVNNGSKDGTQKIIDDICAKDKRFSCVKLAGNFGHQKALLAGMYSVDADMVVTIDADFRMILMLRALIPLLGMKSANVYYDRCERLAGESKYPFFKM